MPLRLAPVQGMAVCARDNSVRRVLEEGVHRVGPQEDEHLRWAQEKYQAGPGFVLPRALQSPQVSLSSVLPWFRVGVTEDT